MHYTSKESLDELVELRNSFVETSANLLFSAYESVLYKKQLEEDKNVITSGYIGLAEAIKNFTSKNLKLPEGLNDLREYVLKFEKEQSDYNFNVLGDFIDSQNIKTKDTWTELKPSFVRDICKLNHVTTADIKLPGLNISTEVADHSKPATKYFWELFQ